MAYSELIKNFNKIRDYMRDFYVYGFKSRDDYTKKSTRSYDDEKRRIESWLGNYMKFHQTADGKNCRCQRAGKSKMQIVAAARSVYVQEFADHVQAVEQAGSHRQRINVRKRYAAARDLRVRKALGARNNQRESGKRAAKRVFFIDGKHGCVHVW